MSKKQYSEEAKKFLYENHDKYTFEEMTEQINTRFGYDKTTSNVKRYMQYLRLKPKPTPYKRKYTEEMDNFIRNNAKGISTFKLMEMFNEQFDINITRPALKRRMVRLGVRNELLLHKDTHPCLTSLKSKETRFKKGDVCKTAKPIGSERVNAEGYIEVKVSKTKWEKKHRVLYEQAYGKLGRGEGVLFLDGNKQNLELSNLMKVTPKEVLMCNKYNLLFENKELTETGVNIAKLMIASKEAVKRL